LFILKKILNKLKYNKIEIGIYNFLVTFHKTNNFKQSIEKIKCKLNCNSEYANYIVSECIKFKYFDGVTVNKSISNHIILDIREHMYITRNGYQFIHDYRINKFNFFWIPFKNLIIIAITAIITVIINNSFSKNKQGIDVSNKITSQSIQCIKVCDNAND